MEFDTKKLLSLVLIAAIGIAIFKWFGNMAGLLYIGIIAFIIYKNATKG